MTKQLNTTCPTKRRAVLNAISACMGLGMLGGTAVSCAGPREALPQRNLVVAWRVSGQSHNEQRQAGIEVGRVVIDSRHGVLGQAGLSAGSYSTQTQNKSQQQVVVLNGGRARIFVGRTQSVTTWQIVGNPYLAPPSPSQVGSTGMTVLPQTVWVDVGQGIDVTPRWSGGRDVVVEVEAVSRQPAQAGAAYGGALDPDGQTRHSEFLSTVSVPVGQWTVVARTGGTVQRSQSGTLSTRDVDESQSQQLEIRIDVP
jgi:hypothetical protein